MTEWIECNESLMLMNNVQCTLFVLNYIYFIKGILVILFRAKFWVADIVLPFVLGINLHLKEVHPF